jgi:long-chain-fatty-acid--CoA ligase ACSBG
MVSHDNLTWTASTCVNHIAEVKFGRTGSAERVVSYLPLSHIAAQMLDLHIPMVAPAILGGNCVAYFAQPDALKGSLIT